MLISRFDPETVMANFHGRRNISSLGFPTYTLGLEACWAILKPGESMTPHKHLPGMVGEIYAIIKGRGLMRIGDEEEEVHEGDVVFIPPEAVHSLTNNGDEELIWFAFWKVERPDR